MARHYALSGLPGTLGGMSAAMPPDWPVEVPPPAMPGWQHAAITWLLDLCPPDYRAYAGWRRHPRALAWLALRHLDGQLVAMRQAYRDARRELGPQLAPEALAEVLEELRREGVRLTARQRSATLIHAALQRTLPDGPRPSHAR